MTTEYDEFFDYHIDSLKFLDYPLWQKYFYTFPKIETESRNFIGKYICSHLVSGSSLTHSLESWYLERLILDLDKLCDKLGWRHIIISVPETNNKYDNVLKNTKKTNLMNGELTDILDIVLNCSAFCGVDSAFRLLGHAKNVPTVTLSKDCQGYAQVPYSHRLRWLCWPQFTFGLHHNTSEIVGLLNKMINNKLYMTFPELPENQVENIIIRRNYKINQEKSIL